MIGRGPSTDRHGAAFLYMRRLWRVLPLGIRIRVAPPVRRLVNRVRQSNVVQWPRYSQQWEAFDLKGLSQRGACGNETTLSIHYNSDGVRLSGWHPYGSYWWLDPRSPYAFRYASLDAVYPSDYFLRDAHPDTKRARELVDWMRAEYRGMTHHELTTVLEFGSGAGNTAVAMTEAGIRCTSVEGTESGCAKLAAIGVPGEQIIQADLRTWNGLDMRFDMVMCTEVLEHIEFPFLGRVVQLACAHADYVWFSSPNPDPKDSPKRLWFGGDYEHCSCMPLAFWDELFAFCGMSEHEVLDPTDCTRRGMRLYHRGGSNPFGREGHFE